ncbi:hypothetical protein CLU79DRAFT_762634 [Phycomyces nitens]|nr:hypothetical protein CLU79DRAFT_762634 [Phycomyces nitens]
MSSNVSSRPLNEQAPEFVPRLDPSIPEFDPFKSTPEPWSSSWNSDSSDVIKSIWKQDDQWSENDCEFDPTLQYYHGSLLDNDTIQDMHLLQLSVTNPSFEETQAENVGEDMSALQMLQSIFTDQSPNELDSILAAHDYDIDLAMEMLLGTPRTAVVESAPKKRQVCRHFLAGECYRKDCRFAHDLQVKVCKFWLQGSCFKGDLCEFSHHFDVQQMVSKKTAEPTTHNNNKEENFGFDEKDYPTLSGSRQKAPSKQVAEAVSVSEEFPSLTKAANMQSPPPARKAPINFAAAAKKKPNKTVKTVAASQPKSHSIYRLRQPVAIPWFETGSALNQQYIKQREKAIEYGMLRNRFFSRATEFYLKGDGAKAKAYSQEAKNYNRLMQEMHAEASGRIFEQRNQYETFVDLHGLHVDEAIRIVAERLDRLRGYEGVVYIVTGTGHHSGSSGVTKKESKLRPNIEAYLRQEKYRFAETSVIGDSKGGIFAVDLTF